jgi:hypothetical protein
MTLDLSLICPGSLVWASDVTGDVATCTYCQTELALEPGDRSGTLPAHTAADDRLPIPTADLPDLIAETQADIESRSDPAEANVLNHVLARLIRMYAAAPGCVDRDHGIGDHPCDEVLGREKAAAVRYANSEPTDDAFEQAREFDRSHPGYWEYTGE